MWVEMLEIIKYDCVDIISNFRENQWSIGLDEEQHSARKTRTVSSRWFSVSIQDIFLINLK